MKRKVRVKGPGIKLNNVWCYINEEAIIDEAQYEDNKEYVEVIEEIEENANKKSKGENKSTDASNTNTVNNEEEISKEELEENNKEDSEENSKKSEENDEKEDEELVKLREEAKELGIRGAHNMKKENLIAKIKEMAESSETETNTENIELSEEN